LPFSEAKAHLSELAERVERERILVTRNGRPSFVLVSPDDLESLEVDFRTFGALQRGRGRQASGVSAGAPAVIAVDDV